MIRARLRLLLLLLGLPVFAILGRLYSIQVDADAHLEFKGRAVHPSLQLIEPARGSILDREGRVLAENIAVFDLDFVYRRLNPRSVVLEVLHQELAKELGGRGQAAAGDADRETHSGIAASFPSPREIGAHLRSLVDLRALERLDAAGRVDSVPALVLVEAIPSHVCARIERRLANYPMWKRAFELRPRGVPSRRAAEDASGAHHLWVLPHRALGMEFCLLRLARLLPGHSFEDLDARVAEQLDRFERQIERKARRDREKGVSADLIVNQSRYARRRYYTDSWHLVPDVSIEVVTELEYWPAEYPGIEARDSTQRHYPLGAAAGALTGYERELRADELERLESEGRLLNNYRDIRSAEAFGVVRERAMCRGDPVGTGGLEGFYDERLRGEYGMRSVQLDSRGRPRSVLASLPVVNGTPLRTTIDAELQSRLYQELAAATSAAGPVAGSIVVLDLPSGAVRASVGFPCFDPNRIREPGYLGELEKRFGSRTTGWLMDRPLYHALYPGSVFKVVTAIAALESGGEWRGRGVDPLYEFECRHAYEFNEKLHCASKYGHTSDRHVNLYEAFQFSCNTYFFYLAHQHVEVPDLLRWARDFGFGRRTGIDLPVHGRRLDQGQVSAAERVRGVAGPCQLSMGQVHIRATTMQVARSMAAIGVGGRSLPTPWIVERAEPEPLPLSNERSAMVVAEGLERVLEPGGTAHGRGGLERFRVACKTGTAQYTNRGKKYHAWLAGYAPTHEPRYAFAMVLEQSPDGGGDACVPLAVRLFEMLAEEDAELWVESPTSAAASDDEDEAAEGAR